MSSEPDSAFPYPYQAQSSAGVPSDLAMAAMLLAGGVALVQLVNAVLAFPAAAAVKESTSDDVFDDVEVLLYSLSTTALIPAGIAAYIVTCLWLGKSRAIAERYAPDYKQERGSVWVWLGWWVPIVSLWFPFQVVRDIRRASIQFRGESGAIVWWWLCWLVWLIGSRVAGALFPEDSDARDAAAALPIVETVNTVAILVALVLWIRTVREITRGQETLVRRDASAIPRW